MSESGANTLIETVEGWALTIGQPVLVLLVFALYFIQAWTVRSRDQVSVDHRNSGGVSLSLPGATGGGPDRRNIPVAWPMRSHRFTASRPPASWRYLPSDMTKALANQI